MSHTHSLRESLALRIQAEALHHAVEEAAIEKDQLILYFLGMGGLIQMMVIQQEIE